MSKRNSDEMKYSKGTMALERDEKCKKEVGPIQLSSKKPKLAFSINKKSPLQNHKEDTLEKPPKQKKPTLREAFNSDTESEEEMPKEARMKMRNFGRDTPTSSGPNSFGKTRHGFCDAKKLFEKQLKRAADDLTE